MNTVLDEGSVLGAVAALIGSNGKDILKNGSKIVQDFMSLKDKEPIGSRASDNTFIGGSISKYTKDLTMTFPTLVDNSLSIETASMISKANERNIVSMLQMLFSAMQLRGTNGKDIIEKIYGKNNRISPKTYDDYVEILTKNHDDFRNFKEDAMMDMVKKMQDELKRPMKSFPVDSFSDNSLNDYSVININGTEKVKFSPVKEDNDPNTDTDINSSIDQLMDNINLNDPEYAKLLKTKGYNPNSLGFYRQDPHDLAKGTADFVSNYNQTQANMYSAMGQLARIRNDNKKFAQQQMMDKATLNQMKNQYIKDRNEILTKQLLDTDVKKANEMQPTLIIVNFSEIDPETNDIIDRRAFVAGVKSRLISVNSSDIVDRIVAKNKTKVSFLNFIRSTTGEISFLKDFVFCLNQAKIDARNAIKRGEAAEMWKTLENLSVKNKRNNLRKTGNDASAITTLVINQETVNMIKKQYEIDINKASVARQIMSDYNLLGIIIADESVEAVNFLYDGQDMFETQSYSFMERENNDKSYKKIINLISQNRRF